MVTAAKITYTDISVLRAQRSAKKPSDALALESLVLKDIQDRALKAGKSVAEYLGNTTIEDIAAQVTAHAEKPEDVAAIITLAIVCKRYQQKNSDIPQAPKDYQEFVSSVVQTYKRNPDKEISVIVASVAKLYKPDQQQQYAPTLFPGSFTQSAFYNPLAGKIQFVDKEQLVNGIYTSTNAADAAVLKQRAQQQQQDREQTERQTLSRLANLQIQIKQNAPEVTLVDELKRAEFRNTFLVRT